MPFPVIDRSRYWAYAGGISSLLVHYFLFSSSTATTTMFSAPTFVTAHSETFSLSLLLTFSLMHMHHIVNKFLKLTYSTNIVIFVLKNLLVKMSI